MKEKNKITNEKLMEMTTRCDKLIEDKNVNSEETNYDAEDVDN